MEELKIHNFRGVRDACEMISNMRKPIVYFDPDIDGGFSGLFICKYLDMIGKEYTWYCNSNRSHDWGISFENLDGKEVIAVDFMIRYDEVVKICESGGTIVSFDHHVNRDEFIEYFVNGKRRGIVVNNQYPFEEESSRYLSGAGVVFESLVSYNPDFNTRLNRSLVGITLLSDIRDIENENARCYLSELYNHPYKGYIKYLIDGTSGDKDYLFGVPRMDRNFVDYAFSPLLNSCYRFNAESDVIRFLLGQGSLNKMYHEMQKNLVSEIMDKITVRTSSNLRVCFFYEKDFESDVQEYLSNFVGLVTSKFLDDGHSAIGYLISYKDGKPYVVRASFRGKINGIGYQEGVSKYVECAGHSSAFGIKNMIPTKELFLNINKSIGEVENNSGYTRNVVKMSMMNFYMRSKKGISEATNNMYRLSQNMLFIKYTGGKIHKRRSSGKFVEYEVDGLIVMCFDPSLTVQEGYILPIMERGSISYYLQK